MASPNATSRSLLEIALGFVGAALVVPLLIKTVFGVAGGLLRFSGSLFRFGPTRRLIGDVAVGALSTLLLREDVLDRLFGKRGAIGDGLLKPSATPRDDD